MQARPELLDRRSLGDLPNWGEQISGQRHAGFRGARLQPPMQIFRHTAYLDSHTHGVNNRSKPSQRVLSIGTNRGSMSPTSSNVRSIRPKLHGAHVTITFSSELSPPRLCGST